MVSTHEPIVVRRSFSKDLTRVPVFVFAPDHREIHLMEKPVIIKGYYHSKVIITRTMSAIQPQPSTSLLYYILRLVRMEDSAAMREVRMVLEKGSPGFRS